MKTDRELLELAAKAAGCTLKWGEKFIVGDDEVDCTDMPYVVSGQPDEADWYWSPLEDDGDALRLASTLEMMIDFMDCRVCAGHAHPEVVIDFDDGDHKRAIVLAAAAIGEAL